MSATILLDDLEHGLDAGVVGVLAHHQRASGFSNLLPFFFIQQKLVDYRK